MNLSLYELSELVSKYIQQKLSDSENLLLKDWLDKSDDNKQLFDRLIQAESIKKSFDYFNSLDIDAGWEKAKRNRRIKRIKSFMPQIAYAATIAGILFSLFLFLPKTEKKPALKQETHITLINDLLPGEEKAYLKLSNGKIIDLDKNPTSITEQKGSEIISKSGELDYSDLKANDDLLAYNTLFVPKTGTYRLVLSDGTKVWLNSLSELKYPIQFGGPNRKVQLSGEAYFEVSEDKTKPFIVEVNNNTIEVLGTHFNVNSYSSNWKATLLEGSVKVINKRGSKLLIPGQEANINENEIIVKKGNLKKVLAWRNNEFYFKNESMHEILVEISRWYDFKINDKGLTDNKRFSGVISKDLKLSEVLKILNFLSGYHFHFDGKELIIKNN